MKFCEKKTNLIFKNGTSVPTKKKKRNIENLIYLFTYLFTISTSSSVYKKLK